MSYLCKIFGHKNMQSIIENQHQKIQYTLCLRCYAKSITKEQISNFYKNEQIERENKTQ